MEQIESDKALILGSLKISTVCLPLEFERDETFDNYRATVAGFGNMLLITPLVPEGKLMLKFFKSYQLNGLFENTHKMTIFI